MIDGITGAAPPATGTTTTAPGNLGKDAFLKLLVAQMRYQNPLSPTDGQQYLAQSAQFATVERLEDIAKAQAELVGFQQILLSTALVGRNVTGTPAGADGAVTGVVTGVRFTAGGAVLDVGGRELPVGAVEEVRPRD